MSVFMPFPLTWATRLIFNFNHRPCRFISSLGSARSTPGPIRDPSRVDHHSRGLGAAAYQGGQSVNEMEIISP